MKQLALLSTGVVIVLTVLFVGQDPANLQPNLGEGETIWVTDKAPFAVCFAPGTSEEYMREWQERLWNSYRSLDFNIGDRWQTTAVSGNTGPQGNPTHVTYSFVPDGTPAPADGGGTLPSQLFDLMNDEFSNEQQWRNLFAQVFDRWSQLSGLSYSEEVDDGVAIGGNNRGIVGVRGDVRISSIPVDGPSGVLAYNFFPDQGDMVLDASENWGSAGQSHIFLRNIVAHEHGHGWGLSHVCPANGTKLLEPFYSSGFDGPQHDDIRAVQRNYGDPYENNDSMDEVTELGTISADASISPVSLDDNSDVDFYRFTIPTATGLTITVQPLGYEYLDGTQQGNGNCNPGSMINSIDDNNLDLYLRNAAGTQTLAQSINHPPGQAEQIFRFEVPQGGATYSIEVAGAAANTVQLYSLDFDLFHLSDPYLTVCPLEFGTTNQGTPVQRSTQFVNPSAGPRQITSVTATAGFTVMTPGPYTIPANSSLDITVEYPATELGAHEGAVTINHNGPSSQLTCSLSGFTANSSLQFVTGTQLNFGDAPVFLTDSARVIIRAQGNTSLYINSISLTPPFSIDFSGPVEMTPTQSMQLWPRFMPTLIQLYEGIMVITHTAPSSPDTVFLTGVGIENLGAPEPGAKEFSFRLEKNYPNPFNPVTSIGYELARTTQVSLKVFDMQGRFVKDLVNDNQAAGYYTARFDGSGLATGLYLYRLTTPEFSDAGKMLFLK